MGLVIAAIDARSMAGSVSGVTPIRACGWLPNSVWRNVLLLTCCGEATCASSRCPVVVFIRIEFGLRERRVADDIGEHRQHLRQRGVEAADREVRRVLAAAPVSDAPIAKTSRLICSLVRDAVPSCARSTTNCASPAFSAGSAASPDMIVSTALAFGTVAWRVVMTRSPFGSVRSTRGAGVNGRSGATGGSVDCAVSKRWRKERGDNEQRTYHCAPPTFAKASAGRPADGLAAGRLSIDAIGRHQPLRCGRLDVLRRDLLELAEDRIDAPGIVVKSANAASRLARPKSGMKLPSRSSRNDERIVVLAHEVSGGYAVLANVVQHAFDGREQLVEGLVVEVVDAHRVEHRPLHVPVRAQEVEPALARVARRSSRTSLRTSARCRRC